MDDRLRAAAQRGLESLENLIADTTDPGVEALGARHELARALGAAGPTALRRRPRVDDVETDEQRNDHAAGNHEYCGVRCENEFPSAMLRNGILARAIPGSATMLDELLRRAARAPLSDVWLVWREDEAPFYGHFAGEDDARQATIDCWQEDEPACPDYSWRPDGPRLELIVGGEHSGVYASRYRVYGAPAAPADRRLADGAQPTTTEAGDRYRPCARTAEHPEAYCRDITGDHLLLPAKPREPHPTEADLANTLHVLHELQTPAATKESTR